MNPDNQLYLLEDFRNSISHFLSEMMTYVRSGAPVHRFGMVTMLEHCFPGLVSFLGPENRLLDMDFVLAPVNVTRFLYHLSTLKVIFVLFLSKYLPFLLQYFQEIPFVLAFAGAGADPANRLRTYRGLVVPNRPNVAADTVPLHVSGGIPIQTYLRDLMNCLINPGAEHALSDDIVHNDSHQDTLSSASGPASLDGSGNYSRDVAMNELLAWFSRHQQIRVRLPNLDHSVYVWRSFLDGEVENHVPPPRILNHHDFYNVPAGSNSSDTSDDNPLNVTLPHRPEVPTVTPAVAFAG